jgi:hypothetical protein
VKKLFSILLILSILIPISGTYTWLKLETHLVKKSVKRKLIEGVDKSELTKLTFSESDLQTKLKWKHSKEFEFNGEMYDIVYTEKENGSTTFYCWWDKAETELNNSVNKLTQIALNDKTNHNTQKNQVQNFIAGLFFIESTFDQTPMQWKDLTQCFAYSFSLKNYKLKTNSPPPQFC